MKTFTAKQSWEEKTYRFGFAEDLELMGEEVGSVHAVEIYDMEDLDTDLESTMHDDSQLFFTGTDVFVRIKAGTTRSRYKITVKIISDTTGQRCELDAVLPVRDI